MTIEEIVRGESKNVEFKVRLPKDSANYIKTIVAFANTQGGQLVIGVYDKTRKVVGVDNEFAFQMMDSIANAVADSCEPQIVPNIELQTIEKRTVIVVTVTPEPNRPYYLKSKGKEKGTFIRLGGTSRPASAEKIKELEMEGARVSWDELTCIGYEVLANVFNQMGFVEAWGTGIRRIKEAAASYGLASPEILIFDDMFRVNLYQNNLSKEHLKKLGESSEKVREKFGEGSEKVREKFGESVERTVAGRSETQKKLLELIRQNNSVSAKAMSQVLVISTRAVEKNIKSLKEQGILIRHGSPRNGYWEIVDE